jgi:CRP-like cAMP-binding protein
MSLENDVRNLGRTRPFDLLPRDALQLIAFSCARKTLRAGETLFSEGDRADAAYFVVSGAIALAAHGVERRAEAGALIGATALIANLPRRASARAAEESVALRIPAEAFRRVLAEFPQAAAKIRVAVAARARDFLDRLEDVRAREFEG